MGKWVTKCSVKNFRLMDPWSTLKPMGMHTMDDEKGLGLLAGPPLTFLS